MKVVILKYNAGNIRSVAFALERIGITPFVTGDADEIRSADKVIFPGVGEAGSAMRFLREQKLDMLIKELKQPVLGICLGMQLMCDYSEEGDTSCLGIFDKRVKRFVNPAASAIGYKVPQIGWNTISALKGPLFKDIRSNDYQYFVHGYYVEQGENTVATTTYINTYSSALQKNNFFAVQFHPEKSAAAGEQILKNFISL